MGGYLNKILGIDGVVKDIEATIVTVNNTINNLRHDTSNAIKNLTKECSETLRTIRKRADRTAFLLTNALLALMTAIALGILLHLTHFSTIFRGIVWIMYASLCLHMILTYVRHSRQQESDEHQDRLLDIIIGQSKDPLEIDLTGHKLNDEDMKIVVNQAMDNNRCTQLQLKGCQITSNSASILADALLKNQTLKQLSLWKNQVTDRGVQSLSNALSLNRSTLLKLDLSENEITDEGAVYLAQMLKTNRNLTHLSLSNNKITDQGMKSLADALQNRNKTLEALSLTDNKLLTDICINSLIDMFRNNQSLKQLWINDCNLSQQGRNRLQNVVKSKELKVYT